MTELLTLSSLASLATLSLLEIVLGIDNLVVISIISAKLPEEQRSRARKLGLALAAAGRIALLLGITWVISLETFVLFELPFELGGHAASTTEAAASATTEAGVVAEHGGTPFSLEDLILVLGGFFLLAKGTWEIHHNLEGDLAEGGKRHAAAGFGSAIAQILAMDLVFSIDSVLTAVGMVRPEDYSAMWIPLTIMIIAVLLAIAVMVMFANPVGNFVSKHPTVKMLALAFMLMIGIVLIAEGLHQHIPRGYIYSAMCFSLVVEMLNLRAKANRKDAATAPA
ncbi:MAG: TerC family protein [Planctomycetota bacterium]|jgi:predicted tellurium resistance membrane protein TerC